MPHPLTNIEDIIMIEYIGNTQNSKKYEDDEVPENCHLKSAINNVIWMYANPDLTLQEAENLSIEVYDKIMGAKNT